MMTVQQASSQIVISVGFVFWQPKWSLSRVETCSGEYRFCLNTSEDHVVISGIKM
jgi:hypothetical protein